MMGAVSNLFVVSTAVVFIVGNVLCIGATNGLDEIYESLDDLYNLHPKPSLDEVIQLINKVSSQIDSVSKQVCMKFWVNNCPILTLLNHPTDR